MFGKSEQSPNGLRKSNCSPASPNLNTRIMIKLDLLLETLAFTSNPSKLAIGG